MKLAFPCHLPNADVAEFITRRLTALARHSHPVSLACPRRLVDAWAHQLDVDRQFSTIAAVAAWAGAAMVLQLLAISGAGRRRAEASS